MKIGVMFKSRDLPVVWRLKFYSSIVLIPGKSETIKDGDLVIGSRHRARVVKNKSRSAFPGGEFDILNDGGISKVGD
jgi:recombination protein RecA